MTVYFIYKHGKYVNTPYLYAVTDKKYLKDSFMKERKKNMFKSIKKDMSKDTYKKFLYEHKSYELGRRGFQTNPASSDNLYKKQQVYLTATGYEEMDVFMKSDKVILEVGKLTHEYAETFNRELLEALHKLHYFEIYKFRNRELYDYDPEFTMGVSSFNESYDYDIDNLGVFIYLYGNTLDKKELMRDEE